MKQAVLALSLLLFLPVLALLSASAHAQVRSEADCEKLENALAYNACLAELGPRVGERRPAAAGARKDAGGPVKRLPGGRKAATFDVISRDPDSDRK